MAEHTCRRCHATFITSGPGRPPAYCLTCRAAKRAADEGLDAEPAYITAMRDEIRDVS